MSSAPPPVTQIVTSALATEIVQQTKVHLNLGQETIIITEDKVRLCLLTHVRRLDERRAWVAPAGILLTLVASFASSTFRDFVLDASTWRAFFVLVAILDFGWLLLSLHRAWRAPTVEDIVATMKHVSGV